MRTATKSGSRGDQIAALASRIKEEVLAGHAPGDKLPPERKLAQRLGTTQSRAHRALQSLVEQGLLLTKVGDGTYVSRPEELRGGDAKAELGSDPFGLMESMRHNLYRKLRVSIPVGDSVVQQSLWRKVLDAFHDANPFVQVLVDFDLSPPPGDVHFTSLQNLTNGKPEVQALDQRRLEEFGFDERELCPGACEPCRATGQLLGVPALRIQSGVWANLDICRRHGVELESLREPGDVFAAAALVEGRSKGRDLGMGYLGYHWHGDNYGLDIRRRDGRLELDWGKLRRFLEEAGRYVGKECLRRSIPACLELFNCGQMAFLTNYLQAYPAFARDRGFAMIPYPLAPDGFTTESMTVGCVAPGCESLEEAYLLLAFVCGREAQSVFVREAPWWFSVNQSVLERQMAESPFPPGAARHRLDLRCYYSFFDGFVFHKFGPAINTEAGKFFLGRQSLDECLQKIKESAT